ncbi:MAG: bifunctional hydroxymethylpyrimidine kinase/phosphomethylpyrimidine kinase, partial [Paracoccaceae bacterium]|nr:bifunctional hydroxymethylpyrimidine kinase/phosphomethylpyrimidine kinase [Paracoccaceae bacterium]
MIPNVLSIAGSDPSGGAGIQADLKAISANGGYAMAAITALTVQNTQGVRDVMMIPPAFIAAQIAAVFDDIRVDAVKIGMLGTAEITLAVARALAGRAVPVVVDPVMVAKGGDRLLAAEA